MNKWLKTAATFSFIVGAGWFVSPFHQAGRRIVLRWVPMQTDKRGESSTRFAREFYRSWSWIKCARAYKADRGGLCERCLAKGLITPGEEVHHKIHLTPENINNPKISLNFDNLELLCKNCHLEEHRGVRWRADDQGHVEI